MLPCPLIVRAHSRLPFGGQPSSTLQRSNVPTFKRSNDSVLLTSLLPFLTIALSSSPDPVGVTARPCSKSFTCNTYSPPRKCCKQKTYGLAKPFRCNTYKKQGGSFSTFRRADEGPIYPPYFLHLTVLPTQRPGLNSFGINSLRTLFIATEGVPLSSIQKSPGGIHSC